MMSDWLQLVQDYAEANPGIMGIMNSPVPADGQRGQVETSTLAQKKAVRFQINYYQARVLQLARQLITQATLNLILPDPGAN